MRRPHFIELGYTLAAVLLIVGLYAVAYCLAVERGIQPISWPGHLMYAPDQVVPHYRFGGEVLFYPAHELDRNVRPEFWSTAGYFSDLVDSVRLEP